MELGLKHCEEITQHAFRGLQNLKKLFLTQKIAKKVIFPTFVIHLSISKIARIYSSCWFL